MLCDKCIYREQCEIKKAVDRFMRNIEKLEKKLAKVGATIEGHVEIKSCPWFRE